MSFGIGEIILVLALVILFFGAKRIPLIARGIGEGIRNFRSSVRDQNGEGRLNDPGSTEERRLPPDKES